MRYSSTVSGSGMRYSLINMLAAVASGSGRVSIECVRDGALSNDARFVASVVWFCARLWFCSSNSVRWAAFRHDDSDNVQLLLLELLGPTASGAFCWWSEGERTKSWGMESYECESVHSFVSMRNWRGVAHTRNSSTRSIWRVQQVFPFRAFVCYINSPGQRGCVCALVCLCMCLGWWERAYARETSVLGSTREKDVSDGDDDAGEQRREVMCDDRGARYGNWWSRILQVCVYSTIVLQESWRLYNVARISSVSWSFMCTLFTVKRTQV